MLDTAAIKTVKTVSKFGECDLLPAFLVGMLQHTPSGDLAFFHRKCLGYDLADFQL